MSLGPAPAIRKLLEGVGLPLEAVNRFEINEALAAQIIAVERELHPLAATGIRLATTLARELRRSDLRYGIASACIGAARKPALRR